MVRDIHDPPGVGDRQHIATRVVRVSCCATIGISNGGQPSSRIIGIADGSAYVVQCLRNSVAGVERKFDPPVVRGRNLSQVVITVSGEADSVSIPIFNSNNSGLLWNCGRTAIREYVHCSIPERKVPSATVPDDHGPVIHRRSIRVHKDRVGPANAGRGSDGTEFLYHGE